METRLRQGERPIAVTLRDAAGGLHAEVDGRSIAIRQVSAQRIRTADGAEAAELVLAVNGLTRRAFVARVGDRVLVSLDGRTHVFALDDPPRRGATGTGMGVAIAPMPGKIVHVLVAAGDGVEPGQPLVVLEAMKMETVLRAEIAGTVARVHVSAGDMVEAGADVVEIAPEASPPS